MACYFCVDTYIDQNQKRDEYDAYINEVKPIVESYGGKYLVRTEDMVCLSDQRKPQRMILIEFPDKNKLERCFSSEEYMKIMEKRANSVDARAVIVEGCEEA